MDSAELAETVERAKARNLPHCTIADMVEAISNATGAGAFSLPEGLDEELTEYLSHYVPPNVAMLDRMPKCVGCETTLFFEWGVVHGSGRCSRCSWPYRLYHKVGDDENGIRWTMMLGAHPDEVSVSKPKVMRG